MSIVTNLIEQSVKFEITGFHKEPGSEKFTHFMRGKVFYVTVHVTIPVESIPEKMWYALDEWFVDPETGSTFSQNDSNHDGDFYWGDFTIYPDREDVSVLANQVASVVEGFVDTTTKTA